MECLPCSIFRQNTASFLSRNAFMSHKTYKISQFTFQITQLSCLLIVKYFTVCEYFCTQQIESQRIVYAIFKCYFYHFYHIIKYDNKCASLSISIYVHKDRFRSCIYPLGSLSYIHLSSFSVCSGKYCIDLKSKICLEFVEI